MSYRAWIAGAALLAALVPVSAEATVMTYLDTGELTSRAALVVRGEVVRQQVVLVRGDLWTDSYIKVSEVLKGATARRGTELVVRRPGGEALTIGLKVSGAARFSRGEQVLVFARPAGPEHGRGIHVTVGMSQGKFRVYRDAAGVERVKRDVGDLGIASFDRAGQIRIAPHPDVRLPDLPLTHLRRAVRRTAGSGGGGR